IEYKPRSSFSLLDSRSSIFTVPRSLSALVENFKSYSGSEEVWRPGIDAIIACCGRILTKLILPPSETSESSKLRTPPSFPVSWLRRQALPQARKSSPVRTSSPQIFLVVSSSRLKHACSYLQVSRLKVPCTSSLHSSPSSPSSCYQVCTQVLKEQGSS
ncbi:hypothetical protein R3P38DRAFT_3362064, partial [Favolaschia claudopus]